MKGDEKMQRDEKYMKKAIALALRGRGKVNPNPLVGAVIVKDGQIIGEGYHERYGEAHAERNAINNAVSDVEGSTMYVTLEPCAHFGKQPPCVDLIIEKKIGRVVIGMVDPNPKVSGKSIEKLKKNNIDVTVGVKEEQCRKINEVFIKFISKKVPFVLLKSAISLDGKIATSGGESKWITSESMRENAHYLRNKISAIMAGVNTVISDDPHLTCRIKDGRSPVRIIVDSNLRIPLQSKVVLNEDKKTIVVCCKDADVVKKQKLLSLGVRVLETGRKNGRVDLKELMLILGENKIDSVLIEGGAELNFSALKEGIVDKVKLYVAPKILGGKESKSCIGGEGFVKLEDAVQLTNINCRQIENEIIVEGYINN